MEDYEIASELASNFGFKLNKHVAWKSRPFKLKQIFDYQLFKIFEHKQMYYKFRWYNNEYISFTGFGGEALRNYWVMSPREFIAENRISAFIHPHTLVKDAINFLKDNIKQIMEKYYICAPENPFIPTLLYKDTRQRNHFGYQAVDKFLAHILTFSPLTDVTMHKLKQTDKVCNDPNLLSAIIFKRYCPELLNFKFEGGRSIAPATLSYAESLSSKYPIAQSAQETYEGTGDSTRQ